MKKIKVHTARNSMELAELLGLSPADGLEFEIRSDLNTKIIEVAKKKRLTHAQVAKLAGTSRTRVTALMNRSCSDISIELMLRILGSMGVHARIQFRKRAA